MIFYYVLILILALIGIRFSRFNKEYISKEQSTAINGLFVLLVFIRHFNQYVIWNDNTFNNLFLSVNSYLGQLIVVPFLFYSGFGIVRSVITKEGYMTKFIIHRFLPVWLSFAVCVSLFLITNVIISGTIEYNFGHILLSFIGWTSVGNSNWYMFVIFSLYVLVYLSFTFIDKKHIKISLIIFTVLSVGLVIILYLVKNPIWWNTILCFALGMWYGYFKEKIDCIMIHPKFYWPITLITLGVFFINWAAYIKFAKPYLFVPLALSLALSIVFISMKVKISNSIIVFLGVHTFSIYMLQRIPMIVFDGIIKSPYIYGAICISITIVISFLFDLVFFYLRRKTFQTKV